eukprot:scaffold258354_cov26-Tisochrysis_lutea.AAC.2
MRTAVRGAWAIGRRLRAVGEPLRVKTVDRGGVHVHVGWQGLAACRVQQPCPRRRSGHKIPRHYSMFVLCASHEA